MRIYGCRRAYSIGKVGTFTNFVFSTIKCLGIHELIIHEVLQQHMISWNIFAHNGKHCKVWIYWGKSRVLKGNEFIMLCSVVEESSIVGMAKWDLCNFLVASNLAMHENKWVVGWESYASRCFLHPHDVIACLGSGIYN